MGKKLKLPVEKAMIKFYLGDIATLKEFYSSVGYNMAVRELVHAHCTKLRERASREGVSANVAAASDLDLDIDVDELVSG